MLKYREGYKGIVHETVAYDTPIRTGRDVATDMLSLSAEGMLTINARYAWDFASGPVFQSRSSKQATLIHDALYQLMRAEKIDHRWKAMIDKFFYDTLLKDGMWYARATVWYWIVTKFSQPATRPSAERPVLVAP